MSETGDQQRYFILLESLESKIKLFIFFEPCGNSKEEPSMPFQEPDASAYNQPQKETEDPLASAKDEDFPSKFTASAMTSASVVPLSNIFIPAFGILLS